MLQPEDWFSEVYNLTKSDYPTRRHVTNFYTRIFQLLALYHYVAARVQFPTSFYPSYTLSHPPVTNWSPRYANKNPTKLPLFQNVLYNTTLCWNRIWTYLRHYRTAGPTVHTQPAISVLTTLGSTAVNYIHHIISWLWRQIRLQTDQTDRWALLLVNVTITITAV